MFTLFKLSKLVKLGFKKRPDWMGTIGVIFPTIAAIILLKP